MALDKKERNKQNAPARKKYEAKTYDKIYIRLRKDELSGEDLKKVAERAGESVNAYIVRAIRERMEREGVSE